MTFVILKLHIRIHMLQALLLLQWNESRRVCRTDTGSTVLDRLVGDRELAQVVSHHFRLDFHLVELLSTVDTNDRSDHLWHNDHVSEVCLDKVGLLIRLGFLLGLSQLLDQTHGTALEASVESTASSGMEDVEELVGGEIEESVRESVGVLRTFDLTVPVIQVLWRVDILIKIDASVGKLSEGSLLLQLGGLFRILLAVSSHCVPQERYRRTYSVSAMIAG
jgi:hypothetical protein